MIRTIDAEELETWPTLSSNWNADLKVNTSRVKVWLSRCSEEDGETRPIQIEELWEGQWRDIPFGYYPLFIPDRDEEVAFLREE